MTKPSITCVSMCGFTMARCFSINGGSIATSFGSIFSVLVSCSGGCSSVWKEEKFFVDDYFAVCLL